MHSLFASLLFSFSIRIPSTKKGVQGPFSFCRRNLLRNVKRPIAGSKTINIYFWKKGVKLDARRSFECKKEAENMSRKNSGVQCIVCSRLFCFLFR